MRVYPLVCMMVYMLCCWLIWTESCRMWRENQVKMMKKPVNFPKK